MVYFIVQIKMQNPEVYQKYVDNTDKVFSKYNGRYLAVDNESEVIEGKWNYSRAVLIQFDSKEDFREWYYSDDYQEILKYRLEGAECDTILVKGLN